MTAALSLSGVAKSFGDVAAVGGVDIELGRHELLALVGPSGCGKSTLLRLVAGLMGVDAGEIRIGGDVVDDGRWPVEPEHRHVGLVFQEHSLFPHLRVGDNVMFGLREVPRQQRPALRDAWLERVGLPGYANRFPHELSGGERQRVALARALAPSPRLMLLDEPFASLDPNLRAQVRGEVVDVMRAAQIPAVFVTHDQTEAMAVGDRVAVMREGRIEQLGPPDEVFHRPANRFVAAFMGEASFLPVDTAGATELGPVTVNGSVIGADAVVVLRPEDVRLVDDGSGVRADVAHAEFRGNSRIYSLRLPSGATVSTAQPHDVRLDVGAAVSAGLTARSLPIVMS